LRTGLRVLPYIVIGVVLFLKVSRSLMLNAGLFQVIVATQSFLWDTGLAPKHRFPVAVVDSFDALKWVYDQVEELGGDRSSICLTPSPPLRDEGS
jgi:hypothetical protein